MVIHGLRYQCFVFVANQHGVFAAHVIKPSTFGLQEWKRDIPKINLDAKLFSDIAGTV